MNGEEKELALEDMLFVALVRDFESMAMVGFGKLIDPATQQVQRDLNRARIAIDMLGMLEKKTKGNLDEVQTALMQQVLTTLRLNYVDELEKDKAERAAQAESKPAAKPAGEEPSS